MKFKFGDHVEVKSGFYEGCTGYLMGFSGIEGQYEYEVKIQKLNGCCLYTDIVTLSETILEAC